MTHHPQVKEENSSVQKADESMRDEFEKEWTKSVFDSSNNKGDKFFLWFLSKLHTERAEIVEKIKQHVDDEFEKFQDWAGASRKSGKLVYIGKGLAFQEISEYLSTLTPNNNTQ